MKARHENQEDQVPRHTVRYGIGMVLLLVAAFAVFFAVIRVAGGQWATVVTGFLAVFLTIAFLSVLGVIIDFVENQAAARRRWRFQRVADESLADSPPASESSETAEMRN